MRGPNLLPMKPHSEERTDAAIPAHLTAGRSPAQEHTGLPERIDVRAQIDAGERPGTVKPPRRERLAARMHTPEVREASHSVDKKLPIRDASSTCPRFVQADYRESMPDIGFHSSTNTNSATRRLRAPAWTAGRARVVPNEMASALGSRRFGSNQNTSRFDNRRRRGYPCSDCLASNHARRPGCPAVYPVLQPVWNPAGNRCVNPVVLPADYSIGPLALTYLTYLSFRHCAKRVASERFVPDLMLAEVLQHREDLFGTGRRKRWPDRRRLCGGRHHATRQSFRCCKTDWN